MSGEANPRVAAIEKSLSSAGAAVESARTKRSAGPFSRESAALISRVLSYLIHPMAVGSHSDSWGKAITKASPMI
jgi:hypothetical protein